MKKRNFLKGGFVATSLLIGTPLIPAFAKAGKKPLLVVGMDAAYPPFGSLDANTHEYIGFDVDIIKAIGKIEGFDVQIKNIAFDGLIPSLVSGSIDIAINDITITEERAKNVDFSHRYYIAGLGIVVDREDNRIKDAKDLEGKRLAVSIGSTGEEAARRIKNAKVRVYNELNECYLELLNGGVDAVINDIPTNDYYVLNGGRGRVKAVPVALSEEDLGIAVKKGNEKLLASINNGLRKIKANGEFAAIYNKWFGRDPSKELLVD